MIQTRYAAAGLKRGYDPDGCSQDSCSMDVHRTPQHMTESDTEQIGFLQLGYKIDWKLLVTLIVWTHQDLKEGGACPRLSLRIIIPYIAVIWAICDSHVVPENPAYGASIAVHFAVKF